MLHERLARGAGEGAAAALHTDRYARSLEGVDILYLGGFDYISNSVRLSEPPYSEKNSTE